MASPTFKFFTACVGIFLLSIHSAHGQYIQAWTWRTIGGEDVPHWRPSPGVVSQPIILLEDFNVWITYNCHYMPSICQNADLYKQSTQGKARRWPGSFGYDLNADRGGKQGRRGAMCPDNWNRAAGGHVCPEPNQPKPMRADKRWPETDVDPTHVKRYKIKDHIDANGNVLKSGMYYSCDEFPPAKWVEGGVGLVPAPNPPPPEGAGQAGFTRCAPAALCAPDIGTKSEQDWQGFCHSTLRAKLFALAMQQLQIPANQAAPLLRDRVVQFSFVTEDAGENDIPASVWVEDLATGAVEDIPTYARIKRRSANETRSPTWIIDKLNRGETWRPGAPTNGTIHGYHVYVNGSTTEGSHDWSLPSDGSLGYGADLGDSGLFIPDVLVDDMGLSSLEANRSADDTVRISDEGRKTGAFTFAQVGDPSSGKKGHLLLPRQPKPQGDEAEAPGPGASSVMAPSSSSSSSANPLASTASSTPPIVPGATEGLESMDIAEARALVQQAIAEASILNRQRIENPSRNRYGLKPGTVVGGQPVGRRSTGTSADGPRGGWRRQAGGNKTPRPQDEQEPSPLYKVTPQVAAAAALVAEFDARQARGMSNIGKNATVPSHWNSTTVPAPSNSTTEGPHLGRRAGPGTFWMEHISRKGTVPWGSDPNYKVLTAHSQPPVFTSRPSSLTLWASA